MGWVLFFSFCLDAVAAGVKCDGISGGPQLQDDYFIKVFPDPEQYSYKGPSFPSYAPG